MLWRFGDQAIKRSIDATICRSDDPTIRRFGDPVIYRSSDPAICRSGDPAIHWIAGSPDRKLEINPLLSNGIIRGLGSFEVPVPL